MALDMLATPQEAHYVHCYFMFTCLSESGQVSYFLVIKENVLRLFMITKGLLEKVSKT